MTSTKIKLALALVAAAVPLAGCAKSTGRPAATTSAPMTSGMGALATRAPAPAQKVSANMASESEIAAALTAAGVPNPQRWAKEVVEYRPYPADDPNLTKLRQNLAKYHPGEDPLNKIVSALKP